MKLHYKTDHTSCMNYKTEAFGGFSIGIMRQGEQINNQELFNAPGNLLLFILEGEVNISGNNASAIVVRGGEFVFIPVSSHFLGTVLQKGRYLSLIFYNNDISLCDKFMLTHYLKDVKDFEPEFSSLRVREPLDLFLRLMEVYLSAGVNCKHLHEIKEEELFIIFRTAYTKNEMVTLFHPIIGLRGNFKSAVLQYKDKVASRDELARMMGMSVSNLARKFKAEFGESVYSWLLKRKDERIRSMLSYPSVTIKEVIHTFNFSSPASFNKYCKAHFGYPPRVLVELIRSEKPKEHMEYTE